MICENEFNLINHMISLKGKIKNGVGLPLEPVKKTDEGREVLITFVEDEANITPVRHSNGGRSLKQLVDEFQVDTGIDDLASQHDHYLYGTPKK